MGRIRAATILAAAWALSVCSVSVGAASAGSPPVTGTGTSTGTSTGTASAIAFAFDGDIYVTDITGRETRLTTSGDNGTPEWSPDHTRILFTSRRDGDAELYVMEARDGSEQTQLTHNSVDDQWPTWSALGTIVWRQDDPLGGGPVLMAMRADGSDPRPFLTRADRRYGVFSPFFPRWSPDGRYLGVSGEWSEDTEPSDFVSVFDVSGSLAYRTGATQYAGWTMDTDNRVYGCRPGGLPCSIWSPRGVRHLPYDAVSEPSVSIGRRFHVYTTFTDDGVWSLAAYDRVQRRERILAPLHLSVSGYSNDAYDWSPDGTMLVVQTTTGLDILSPDGRVFRSLGPRLPSYVAW